jgi:ADP-ribose pyrophosphatase YjhB (NUDIX family)
MKNKQIELLVRAIIKADGNILVCRKKGEEYYFLPGGHVEFGETSEYALKRELWEELDLEVKNSRFIGGSEHMFTEDGVRRHEINLAFEVETEQTKTESREDHLQFFLLTPEEFQQETILPTSMQKAVSQWFQDKEKFWASEL